MGHGGWNKGIPNEPFCGEDEEPIYGQSQWNDQQYLKMQTEFCTRMMSAGYRPAEPRIISAPPDSIPKRTGSF